MCKPCKKAIETVLQPSKKKTCKPCKTKKKTDLKIAIVPSVKGHPMSCPGAVWVFRFHLLPRVGRRGRAWQKAEGPGKARGAKDGISMVVLSDGLS